MAEFALAPGLLPNNAGFIDYSTREGQKLYETATAPLWTDKKFDGSSGDLSMLKAKLMDRALTSGWIAAGQDIINIPEDMADPDETLNIINQSTLVDRESITEWADDGIINEQTRKAQNNFLMFVCLENSIDDKLRQRLLMHEDEYTRINTKIAALFYKLIISKCALDTKATVASIRSKLAKLESAIETKYNFDIKRFNDYVNELVGDLRARNEETHDLLTNLFSAYSRVDDEEFRKLIRIKESNWLHDEGGDLDAESLMVFAEADYSIRMERGTWRALTEDQQKIVALQATLKKYEAGKGKGKEKKKKDKSKDKDKSSAKENKDKDKSGKEKEKASKWKWKKEKPTDLNSTKVHEGKTYHWCKKHNKWTLHKTSECRLEGNGGDSNDTGNDANSESGQGRATFEASMAVLGQGNDSQE